MRDGEREMERERRRERDGERDAEKGRGGAERERTAHRKVCRCFTVIFDAKILKINIECIWERVHLRIIELYKNVKLRDRKSVV